MGRDETENYPLESAGDSVSILVKYGEVAVGAREYLAPSANEKAFFVDLDDLREGAENTLDWGNPCDPYSVILDGEADAIPTETGKSKGFFSEQISDENGFFAEPIILRFESNEYRFSSKGITLEFDTETGIRAEDISIKWYSDENIIDEKTYKVDSSFYFCENEVSNYNAVEIEFYNLNMPFAHLQVRGVEWGFYRDFSTEEIKSISVRQELDPLSAELSSNYCDIKFEFLKNIDFQFRKRQPMLVYRDDELVQKAFIEKAKQSAQNAWTVECGDYIEILSENTFTGDLYFDKNAVELIGEIFNAAKVPYYVDPSFDEVTVSGRIGYTDCREALKEVAFAIGAVVDTSGEEVVVVKPISQEVSQNIPKNRIMGSQNFSEQPLISSVEVVVTEYLDTGKEYIYQNTSETVQEDLTIIFQNPVIVDSVYGEGSELFDYNHNYARVTLAPGGELIGIEYEPKKTAKTKKTDVQILPNESGKKVSVENAGLVNFGNVDNILLRCYNYYINEDSASFKIFEGKHEKEKPYGLAVYGEEEYSGVDSPTIINDKPSKVGDLIGYDTQYKGKKIGRIISQKFNLLNGAITKQTEVV